MKYLNLLFLLLSCSTINAYAEQKEQSETKKEDKTTKKDKNEQIDEIEVTATLNANSITNTATNPSAIITSEEVKTRTVGNGNATDLLQAVPSVQFSNGDNAGHQQGEIKPSKVSIRGASSFQNNYMLDGMSMNNDIDPSDSGNGETSTRITSSDQGFFVDSHLIDNIKVYDKNIPVEYGGFTGGVVDITSRRWQFNQGGSVYINRTGSNWNKVYVDKKADFSTQHNTSDRPNRFQPKYSKLNYGGWFETGLSDTSGLVISFSRRESDISSYAYQGEQISLDNNNQIQTSHATGGYKNQTRESNNLSTKFSWYMTENTFLDFAVNYSGYENYSFAANSANSGYTTDHNGLGSMLQLTSQQNLGDFELTLGYNLLNDKRNSDQKYSLYTYEYNMMNNKTTELNSGSLGDLQTKQKDTTLKAKFTFNKMTAYGIEHNPKIGFDFSKVNASYIRDKDYFRFGYYKMDLGSWGGVMDYWNINAFKAGTYKADYSDYAIYADDTLSYGKLTLQPGIRIDYDNFVEKYNLSPRLSGTYDLLGNGQTNLIAGINRYYGRNMLVYALYGAQNDGMYTCNTCPSATTEIDSNWLHQSDYEGLDSLKTPYSDEINFGLEQQLRNSLWKFEYVHRNSKNEITSRPKTTMSRVRIFENGGKSTHDSFTISVNNIDPWRIGVIEKSVKASIVWEKNQSNTPKNGYAHYDASGATISKDYVYYNGKLIKSSKLPATDFNLPLKFILEDTTTIPDINLSIYNKFQLNGKRSQAVRYTDEYKTINGQRYARYEREDFASTFRWDVKLLWQPEFAKGANMSVEVLNLLKKRNVTDRYAYGSDTNGNPIILDSYDIGRQFWIQFGYDF
ncbi:TonB-dependent receptor plug domain-containing protein [Orbaceae bacterium ac157xtp]